MHGQGVVSRAGPGDCFGELALLYDSPRAATVEAVSRCHCWSLELGTFKRIVKGNAMQRNARYYTKVSHRSKDRSQSAPAQCSPQWGQTTAADAD